MNVGHTFLLYVAITAVVFIALDGLIESGPFSILEHDLPIEKENFDDWAIGSGKKTSLETRYAMVYVFFGLTVP
jgi:hypothetical protein